MLSGRFYLDLVRQNWANVSAIPSLREVLGLQPNNSRALELSAILTK